MRYAVLILICASSLTAAASEGPILLGGERIRIGADSTIEFTASQIRRSEASTRAGLMRWAATAHGRRLLSAFAKNQDKIVVIEDREEEGAGRAPQPGMATLLAAADPAQMKVY